MHTLHGFVAPIVTRADSVRVLVDLLNGVDKLDEPSPWVCFRRALFWVECRLSVHVGLVV